MAESIREEFLAQCIVNRLPGVLSMIIDLRGSVLWRRTGWTGRGWCAVLSNEQIEEAQRLSDLADIGVREIYPERH